MRLSLGGTRGECKFSKSLSQRWIWMTTAFYDFFFSPLSLRPIKLSFQMSSHSVTPSPWWPPQKRGKNVLWMLNREYEDPYCERVTRSSISFSLRDRHRVIISKSHSQGFRSRSLDMHSIALNFGACSSEVMIYSEWKIKRGDETQPWSLWRAPSQLTLFTPSVTLMCQLFHRPHVLFHFIFLHTLRVVWWLLTRCQRNVLRCCRTDREACQSRANFASELQWKKNKMNKKIYK